MPIIFNESTDKIRFEYHDTAPNKMVQLHTKTKYQLNITLLQLYGLYRNSVYDSYKQKSDLAKDIKEYNKVFHEKETAQLITDPLYHEPLYHYSVAASLGAMKDWNDSDSKMKCYIAYQMDNGHKCKIGFVHFIEKVINDKSIIYIASAGVSQQGKGIGRRLMECVLSHYPAETEFYILTRTFNTEAINLYHKRLNFQPIGQSEIAQFGCNERYCGFKRTTTESEVRTLRNKQLRTEEVASIIQASKNDKKHAGRFLKGTLLGAAAITFGFVMFQIFTKPKNISSTLTVLPKISRR